MTSDPMVSYSLRRRLVFVGFTLAVLVLAAGIFAEIAYRIFAPTPEVYDLSGLHEFRPDREWLYRGRPGAAGEVLGTRYEINADGFRGPVHSREPKPGVFRIVVLGDSIAFGFGVREEQTFVRVLERLFAQRAPEAQVEVVNLGTGGYSAWNEARLLEDVGVAYRPDVVLVQFSINDLNDPTVHFGTQTRLALGAIPDAAYPNPSRRGGFGSLKRQLSRGCHLLKLCTALRQRLADRREPEPRSEEFVRAFRDPVERTDRVEWRWLEDRYLEMASAAEAAGARFALLAFPYPQQMAGSQAHPVSQHLKELAVRHGWLFADPLPRYREVGSRGARLFMDIWHPTVLGHEIAAQETLRALVCEGALEAHSPGIRLDPAC